MQHIGCITFVRSGRRVLGRLLGVIAFCSKKMKENPDERAVSKSDRGEVMGNISVMKFCGKRQEKEGQG